MILPEEKRGEGPTLSPKRKKRKKADRVSIILFCSNVASAWSRRRRKRGKEEKPHNLSSSFPSRWKKTRNGRRWEGEERKGAARRAPFFSRLCYRGEINRATCDRERGKKGGINACSCTWCADREKRDSANGSTRREKERRSH